MACNARCRVDALDWSMACLHGALMITKPTWNDFHHGIPIEIHNPKPEKWILQRPVDASKPRDGIYWRGPMHGQWTSNMDAAREFPTIDAAMATRSDLPDDIVVAVKKD
jgi:hypothetical protein